MDTDDEAVNEILVAATALGMVTEANSQKNRKRRSVWVHPVLQKRKQFGEFYHLIPDLRLNRQEHFYAYHRMTVETYDTLLKLVSDKLTKHSLREPIPPAERLSLTLRYLATGDAVRSIAWNYRIGKCTAHRIIRDTCKALWDVLQPLYLAPPNNQTWQQSAEKFQEMWQFPNALGSIDGKHVVMQQPVGAGSDYFNYKTTNSIVLLAVVDAEYRFLVVDVGVNGRISDGGVFSRSAFYEALTNDTLQIPSPQNLPGNTEPSPFVFIADDAFPLRQDLMKPFSGRLLDDHKKQVFNYRLSRARRVVENAFGILVARWMIFRRAIIARIAETVEFIVKATVCLHNFLMSDGIKQQNGTELLQNTTSDGGTNGIRDVGRIGANNYTKEAAAVREQFANFFISNPGAVSWQDEMVRRGGRPE